MSKPDIDMDQDPKTNKFLRKSKGGRPSDLTREIINKICNFLRLGTNLNTAIVMVGIPSETYHHWIKQGHKKPDSLYGELLKSVNIAVEEATIRDLQVIDRHIMGTDDEFFMIYDEKLKQKVPYLDKFGNPVVKKKGIKPDPSLAQWRLSKRRPKEWGNVIHIEEAPKGEMTEKERIQHEKDNDALLDRYLEVLRLTK